MTQTISTLSRKRIVISLILTAMIPTTARILNIFLDQEQISLMFSMNIFTSVLIMYNWNLVAIHYNRAKENIPDTILYTLIGGALIFLWSLLGLSFFQAHLILPPSYALIGYGVIDYDGAQSFHVAAYGAISTEPKTPFELRLKKIYEDLNYIIGRTRPDVLAIEKLFFTNNKTTGYEFSTRSFFI